MPHSIPHKKVKVQPLRFTRFYADSIDVKDEKDLRQEILLRGGSLYTRGSNGATIEMYVTKNNNLAIAVQYEKRSLKKT